MPDMQAPKNTRLGFGGWVVVFALLGLLGAAGWFAFWVWNSLAGVEISTNGIIAMVMGVVFSIAVGGGLMALVFYSNRKGYDR